LSKGTFTLKLSVRAYDGSSIAVTEDVVDHVVRKHSETLSLLGLTREDFVKLLRRVLEEPDEVYVDAYDFKYFLKKMDDLHLNVIVGEETVKTAYLISQKTHFRMRKKRWLRRL
jgi:hypothetical protein